MVGGAWYRIISRETSPLQHRLNSFFRVCVFAMCGEEFTMGVVFINFRPSFYQPKKYRLKSENESPMYMTFKYIYESPTS